jgi:hypothetical protein
MGRKTKIHLPKEQKRGCADLHRASPGSRYPIPKVAVPVSALATGVEPRSPAGLHIPAGSCTLGPLHRAAHTYSIGDPVIDEPPLVRSHAHV